MRGGTRSAPSRCRIAGRSGPRALPKQTRKAGGPMPIGRPNVERMDAHNQVEGLLRATKYKKDPELAEQARLALERRMPVLLDTFQSKNTRHMVLARDAFRQVGQPAVPFLTDVVDHGDTGKRQDAIHILGEVGLPTGLPALTDGLRDRDSGVRLLAVRSLAKIAGPQAIELLQSALRDRDEDVRVQAIKVLKKRGVGTP